MLPRVFSESKGTIMPRRKLFTVSNALSVSRVVLLIPIYKALSQNTLEGNTWALFFMLIAVVTDFLDGYMARHLNQVSDWGKVLDPLADKICIFGVCLILALPVRENILPLWFLLLLLLRELMVVGGGIYLYRRRQIIAVSNIWGKSTSFVLALMLISYVVKLEPSTARFSWLNYEFLLWLSFSFLLVSTVSYGIRFYRVMGTRQNAVQSGIFKTNGAPGETGSGQSGGEN
jgi:CDP-diacylglycerol--glycerol-3-phosphate 3-phosphatidyltransferase